DAALAAGLVARLARAAADEAGALAGRGARVRLAVSLVGGVAGLALLALAVHDAELLCGGVVGAAGLVASAATPYRALLRARLRMGGYVGLLAAQAALAVGLLAAVVVVGGGLVAVFAAVSAAATPAGAAGAAREAARGLVIALLPPAAALALWAEPVLTGFFGPSFAAAAPVLRVLAPATLLGATGAVLTNLLVAVGRQRTLLRVTAGAAAGMIALGAALVPTYGAVGAAVAFVAVGLSWQVAMLAPPAPRLALVTDRRKAAIRPASKEGFRAALALEPEFVVQMDADLSHPPGMLPEFVRLAADHDLVLGSRYLHGITVVNWPMDRLLLSYFGNTYVRIVTGMPIRDATSGFKCWRRAATR